MALWVHVHGGYPSYGGREDWADTDWDAMKMVKALKGLPFKRSATITSVTGQRVTFTENHRDPAFQLWGQWASAKLAQIGLSEAILMAVPSSSCVTQGGDAKGKRLMTAIQRVSPKNIAIDGLWWTEAKEKASAGGSRDADVLKANLTVRDGPQSTIVLVDDVVSSGGHLLACARALRERGHTIEHALCVAQTVNSHPANMWAIESRDLEANPFAGLFDAF